MPTKAKSPNGTAAMQPQGQLPPRYEWVECERDDINEGLTRPLRIKVLVNPTRAQIIALSQGVSDILEGVRDRLTAAQEARTAALAEGKEPPEITNEATERTTDQDIYDLIAPRIVAWNLQLQNTDGELFDAAPPAENPYNLQALLTHQASWVLRIVQNAHLGGDARSKLSRRPAPMASTEGEKTPSGPQIVPTPTTATHQTRRKSS